MVLKSGFFFWGGGGEKSSYSRSPPGLAYYLRSSLLASLQGQAQGRWWSVCRGRSVDRCYRSRSMFTQRDRLTWGHPPVRVRPASLRLLTLSIKWPRSFSLCSLILHQVSLTPLIFSPPLQCVYVPSRLVSISALLGVVGAARTTADSAHAPLSAVIGGLIVCLMDFSGPAMPCHR